MTIRKLFIITALALLLVVASDTVQAKELIIGVSPFENGKQHDQLSKTLLKHLSGLEPGDQAVIIDAYHLRPLGTFVIPDNPAYRSIKARLNKNGAVIKALLSLPNTVKDLDDLNRPSAPGAIRMPQFVRYVARNFGQGDKELLVLGSLNYDDPKDPGFSMWGGLIPNDGHLRVSRMASVYGTADSPKLLEGWRIHWVNTDKPAWRSDRYKLFLNRFWSLFIALQGGTLVAIHGDLPTALQGIQNRIEPLPHRFQLSDTTRLEMIRLRENLNNLPPIHQRALSNYKLSARQLRHARSLEIGITWACACDLDLYARPRPGAEVLYFNHQRSPDGSYFKDYRSNEDVNNAFETIAFKVPVDLRELQVAVNFFSGKAKNGARGEIRIAVDGETYSQPFLIKAREGNGGEDMQHIFKRNHQAGKHSVVIDPLSVVLHDEEPGS